VPVNKLDVNGSAAIGASYAGSQTAPANGLIVQGNVGIGTINATGNYNLEVYGNFFVHDSTGTTLWMANHGLDIGSGKTPPGSGFTVPTGNTGLGTWVPFSRLDVVGGVGVGGNIGDAYVTTLAPTGGMIIEGNVGIGTTAPAGSLTVMSGNVGVGTWMPQALLDVSTGGGNPAFLAGTAPQSAYIQNNLEVDGTAYLVNATIGSLTLSTGLTMTGGTSLFNQIEVTGTSIFNTKNGGSVGIGTTMTGAAAGTALAVIGGNVGIGTTARQRRWR